MNACMDPAFARQLDPVTIMEELPQRECLRLLTTRSIGRIGFSHEERPMVLPVQYVYRNGEIILRTAYGSSFDRAVRGIEVAFEIDAVDPGYHAGWSVMVRGLAEGLDENDTAHLVDESALRPWGLDQRPGWVRIAVSEVTGRRIMQSRPYDRSAQ
jgi:nitroimidazol reductase NimA-like FMN-containing flavoprotein (pyridoxamine 5'-phosphate oxidase superfamily)